MNDVAEPASAGPPAGETVPDVLHITATDLGTARGRIGQAAAAAGFEPDQAGRFTVAVNEIMMNAVQHGGGLAEVTITHDGPRLIVDVRDTGGLATLRVPTTMPPIQQSGGRGLWLAQQLCDSLTILPSLTGTLVRLSATATDR